MSYTNVHIHTILTYNNFYSKIWPTPMYTFTQYWPTLICVYTHYWPRTQWMYTQYWPTLICVYTHYWPKTQWMYTQYWPTPMCAHIGKDMVKSINAQVHSLEYFQRSPRGLTGKYTPLS